MSLCDVKCDARSGEPYRPTAQLPSALRLLGFLSFRYLFWFYCPQQLHSYSQSVK